ncbi:MAG: DUF3341 domain-containing protein [Bdellovibrionales bacterium]|nr:DUF3341 domain-containing protein [Bdellovibrionales bacterium]
MSLDNIVSKIEGILRSKTKQGFVGIWEDEHKMIAAAHEARKAGCTKFDAITPFPMHAVDEAIGLKRSYIPWVTFIFGTAGCLFGIWFTWWTSAVDWPIIIGGKPMMSFPAFIPVIFECTILLAALSSVGALLFICGLPKVDPPVIDPDLTSHKFAIFVPEDDTFYDTQKLEKIFKDHGATDTRKTEF